MYTTRNFKTKKALKDAVNDFNRYTAALAQAALAKDPNRQQTALVQCGLSSVPSEVRLYAPGLGKPNDNGSETVEGPHFPAPHTWYASVVVKDGIVIKVK